MKEIHLKRLERLAKEHERLSKKRGSRLYMQAFFHGCGTPACSLGYATTIPAFRKSGLRVEYEVPRFHGDWGGKFFGITDGDSLAWKILFDGFEYDADGKEVFDSSGGYINRRRTHLQQARVIRKFVAEQRAAMKPKKRSA